MAAEAVVVEREAEEREEPDFPEVRVARRFVINRDGKDYVLFAGLVDLLHQISDGFFEVNTTLVQIPGKDNGDTAIATARVIVFDPENPDVAKRIACGIGDAAPGSVTRLMAPHLIRMAETRAKARALRDLCNVAMVALEELGPQGADDHPERQPEGTDRPFPPPEPRAERIQHKGQWWTRPQVIAGYKKVVAEALAAGMAIPPGDLHPDDAPLPVLAGAAQALRTRLDAREGKA